MKFERVLVPTDFSPACDAALTAATQMARGAVAPQLIIVHVEELVLNSEGQLYEGLKSSTRDELRQKLERVRPQGADVACQHHLLVGDPAKEIIRLAVEEKVDLIVLSTHGRTGLRRLLMGSVAETVVRGAPCPVFVFRVT